MALVSAAGAMAAPSQRALEILSSRTSSANTELPARARADSGVKGVLNAGALSAPTLELTFANGEKATAHLSRVARDDKKGVQSWVGTFDGSPGSVLVLSKARGVITGYGNYQNRTLEILPSRGGQHLMFEVDGESLPQADVIQTNAAAAAAELSTSSDYGTGGSTLAVSGAVVHDVLILYTAASASKWGQATLESMVQSAVQAANQAYQNSQAGVTLNVVGLQQSSITEGSGMAATVDRLKTNSTVRSMRDSLAADMVVLIAENTDYCGYATLWYSYTSTSSNWDAYAAVQSSCLSSQTLAHEVGHLQQLDHNRENKTGLAAYEYSYGYRLCTTGGFRDIMSYPCSMSVTRINNFSNPNVAYNGYPTGISYEASPSTSADTARTLNNTAQLVASYRVGSTATPTPTAPAAPSGLAVQSALYNKVTIGWTDNSSNETGFKVERSTDGVTFAEIATLGADTRSFADVAVAARTSYYYRVRAYNSVGASAYSSAVRVTTPDVPPPAPVAPTSVAAGDNGDGTARVSWTTGATTATSFELRREKWDSRKRVWTGATLAATVPASVLSAIDSTGAGTFRYTVRALNAGGASAYAGPASVTVTSATSTTKKAAPGRRKT
jgi:hypothetical protein